MKTKSTAASCRYDYAKSPPIDQVGIVERAARFTTRSIKSDCKRAGLAMVLNMIDLTTLEGADTPNKVRQLPQTASNPAHLPTNQYWLFQQ